MARTITTSPARAATRACVMIALVAMTLTQPPHSANARQVQVPTATTLRSVVSIVSGAGSFCALTNTGAVLCWGGNNSGQLGNGTKLQSNVPVTVTGLSSGVTTIAAGDTSVCAIVAGPTGSDGGALKCWGDNTSGQLGDGSLETRLTPVTVNGLNSGVQSVAVGAYHACALTTGGAVKCWGFNGSGQIGNNTMIPSSLPLDVSGLGGGVLAIDAGTYHTCARFAASPPQCWGSNNSGQLGDGGTTNSLTPKPMTVITTAVDKISAGQDTTCVIVGGALKCWGNNDFGKLGNGTTTNTATPVTPAGFDSNVIDVDSSYLHTCAVRSTGSAACWGYNVFGSLGAELPAISSDPVPVKNARGLIDIAVSIYTTCAVSGTGAVQCWGRNYDGQLGVGTSAQSGVPTAVQRNGLAATTIEAGLSNTCAVLGGIAKCWGSNNNLALGDGSDRPRRTPSTVTAMTDAVAVSPGFGHACGRSSTGNVLCWGINDYGQLGTSAFMTATFTGVAPVGLGGGVEKVATANYHTCALRAGIVYCWGASERGQAGVNQSALNVPTAVAGLGGPAKDIDVSFFHTCALLTSGAVNCWGLNQQTQLGVTSPFSTATPVTVNNLPPAKQIATGGYHTCALDMNGGVWCWGWNAFGQLGNNTLVDGPMPVNVQGLTAGIQAITAGDSHSCALTNGGGVKCWGLNSIGQLGAASTAFSSTIPVDVQGLSSGVVAISSADEHTCARLSDGGLRCWGDGLLGQLGDGNAWTVNGVTPAGFIAGRVQIPLLSKGDRQESEPNNNSTQANTLVRNVPLRAAINDAYDVFVIDTTSAGDLTIALSGVPADVLPRMQLQLYYQTVTVDARVAEDTTAPFEVTRTNGPAGRYYAVVFVAGSAFNPAQSYEVVAR
jgi:alpha-tubulin suppressor-like RCC1 family protein